jgi:hypothetical protein
MVRKYFGGCRSGGTQEVHVSQGFFGNFGKRFTLALGEPITIAATGRQNLATQTARCHGQSPLARRASG